MADTVIVIRLGERKMELVPLPKNLLTPEETFINRSPALKSFLFYGGQQVTLALSCEKFIPLRIILFNTLGNDGGSDFIDGPTSPVADPLQVGKDLF